MTTLPEMTVEQRDSSTAHGIPPYSTDVEEQLELAIELNDLAKHPGWDQRAIDILQRYSPIPLPSAREVRGIIQKTMGYQSWAQVSRFVVDDMCSEFFNMMLKHCLKTGQQHKDNLGFIDGSGIGYLGFYRDRLKVVLEQTFDAKWYYQKKRPLVYALEDKGINLTPIANAIHPGHWAYPAGHGAKFLCSVECLDKVFNLSDGCYEEALISAIVAAHGRSGNLIHFPEDNCASDVLLDLR